MPTASTSNQRHLLAIFISAWTVLNLFQAALVNVDADEAYYWLLSQHLSWGYFDHPPLVMLAIQVGELFGHGAFFTRLVTVLTSAGTVYLGFKLLPETWRQPSVYLAIFSSVALFHVYSFITTPDAFLLFFTVLFFVRYKCYLRQASVANILLLALSIIGMLYSKYHGVLPVLFTFLSNPRLITKPSAWCVVGLVALAFGPHLYWQYQHNWPTFRYHLSERVSSAYRLDKTTNYLATQAIIWGPFTTLPAIYLFFRKRLGNDVYLRAHYFNFFGVLLFFLLSSFRSTIEAHWTLAAGPSFVVLLHAVLVQLKAKWQKRLLVLLCINAGLLLIARLLLIFPLVPIETISGLKAMVTAKSWADSVYQKAAGTPVIFPDSYSAPALYRFYHPSEKAIGYNTTNYRKTHFNLLEDEASLNNQPVYVAWSEAIDSNDIAINSSYANQYLHRIDSFVAVNGLQLTPLNLPEQLKAGESFRVTVELINQGSDTVSLHHLTAGYVFFKTRKEQFRSPAFVPLGKLLMLPNEVKQLQVVLQTPLQKGTYTLIFSVVQPPFGGNFASRFYKVDVE